MSPGPRLPKVFVLLVAMSGAFASLVAAPPQTMSRDDASTALDMLHTVADDVRKDYYDPSFHGVDFNAKVKEAEKKIPYASSFTLAVAYIAEVISSLGDSHTEFLPPLKDAYIESGWRWGMVADKCMILAVRPGTDAEAKGVKPGDQVLQVDNYVPTRANLSDIGYVLFQLEPREAITLRLRSPEGTERQLRITTRWVPGALILGAAQPDFAARRARAQDIQKTLKIRMQALDDVLLVKLPTFSEGIDDVTAHFGKFHDYRAVVLDLRGNSGGSLDETQFALGFLFDHAVKLGERVGRKSTKTIEVKPRGSTFRGQLVVLVDAGTRGTAEIFARALQFEKRATLIGDRTAGDVGLGEWNGHRYGNSADIFYGDWVTVAQFRMADGINLEKIGVTPDELLLPAPADFAAGRDPVLARAASLAGHPLTPEKAGEIFPVLWHSF